MRPATVDWVLCEGLATRAADGEASAFRELVEAMWPVWLHLAGNNRALGALGTLDDHAHDVVLKLVEKLGRADGRGLRLYRAWRERHPDKTFEDWTRIVVANAVRDYRRERLGQAKTASSSGPAGAPSSSPDDPSVKRLLNEFAEQSPALDRLGARPPMTAAQTARQLLEFARARLPPNQCLALMHWMEDATFEEIDAELGLGGPEAARKLIRAAVGTLRRQFAGGA